jgi:hypothetical protein
MEEKFKIKRVKRIRMGNKLPILQTEYRRRRAGSKQETGENIEKQGY